MGPSSHCISIGENPWSPTRTSTIPRRACRTSTFLVVQDIFLTETAQLADVGSAAVCFAEKRGRFRTPSRGAAVRASRRILPVRRAGLGDYLRYATRWGYRCRMPTAKRDGSNEIRQVTPSYAGISYKRINRDGITLATWSQRRPSRHAHTASGAVYPRQRSVPCDRLYPPRNKRCRSIPLYLHHVAGCSTSTTPDHDHSAPRVERQGAGLPCGISPDDAQHYGYRPGAGHDRFGRGSIQAKVKVSPKRLRERFYSVPLCQSRRNRLTHAPRSDLRHPRVQGLRRQTFG